MNTVEKFVGLVNAAHGNAIAKGWWEKERTLGELVALIHTEGSEAMEDFRKGHETTDVWYEYNDARKGEFISDVPQLEVCTNNFTGAMEQALGKPCGIPSELADIVIRVFDLVGKHEVVEPFANFLIQLFNNNVDYAIEHDRSFGDNMGWLHASISKILTDSTVEYAAETVYNTYKLAEYSGIDLDAIITEKMAYNTRREYRHGGKVL
ncbi:MAG: hypothetical protein ABS894_00760 [Aerococcus urinaeequi]